MDFRELCCEDERWMELAQAGFDISGVEPSGSATRGLDNELVIWQLVGQSLVCLGCFLKW